MRAKMVIIVTMVLMASLMAVVNSASGQVVGSQARVTSVEVSPKTIAVGGKVSVTVRVGNDGDAPGTLTLIMKVDGREVGKQDVQVNAGKTATVSFEYVETVIGEHTVNVNGVEVPFTAARPAPMSLTLMLALAWTVLAAAIGAWLFLRARARRYHPR